MGFIKTKTAYDNIGKRVILTKKKEAMIGCFTIGSIVTITAVDMFRGYTIEDDNGNKLIETGFDGFEFIKE